MKQWYLVVFFLLVGGVPGVLAEQVIPSRIVEVTVYSEEAHVTREATAAVTKGLQKLWVELEAFRVDKDSFSAKVFGAGEVYGVQFREIAAKESPQGKIQILEQQIKEGKKTKRVLSDRRDVAARKEQFLQSLLSFSETQVPKDVKTQFPKIEDLNNALDFIGSGFQTLYNTKQALDEKIATLNEEIMVWRRELKALGAAHQKRKMFMEIVFNSGRSQTIRVEANYIARKAFWRPLYKVSVPLTLEAVEMTMLSTVGQKTGEDWNDVALTLSNVIPLKGLTPPVPSSWILDMPRVHKKARVPMGAAHREVVRDPAVEEMDEVRASAEIPDEEATVAHARTRELPLSFEYEFPRKIAVASRDEQTILPLFERTLQGEFFYYVVPRKSSLTFLVCRAEADTELISGTLNVYFSGRFIGKTYLTEKKAGEDFSVTLGADREVKVSRVKLKDKVKETLFGNLERSTVVREFEYRITAENLKSRPIRLDIVDPIPVSRTDKITVKDVKVIPEPEDTQYRDKEGVLRWEYRLEPGEKQNISITFVVAYPKDVPIVGLW